MRNVIELRILLKNIGSDYRNGLKYIFVDSPVSDGSLNFCSERCKTDYNYSH